jgi:hypothetical protein
VQHQGGGFDAETKLLAKGRQLDAPARSDEQWSADLLLQGAYRFGDGGLSERQSLRRSSEMEILRDRQEAVDLPQFHRLSPRQPIDRTGRLNASLRSGDAACNLDEAGTAILLGIWPGLGHQLTSNGRSIGAAD